MDERPIDSENFVIDVYDFAAEIGKEYEKIIDKYGTDFMKELMKKVIVILEYLENGTVIVEKLQNELFDIRSKVKQLEHEKLERSEFRSKLDQDLEVIEENWRQETSYLNSLVAKLQGENKRLSKILSEKEIPSPEDCKTFLSDEDLAVVQKLKDVTAQQRAQIIIKDKEVLEKSNELEKLQVEVERLTKANRDLSHKNRQLQKQMYTLVEEKTDLQANLQSQQLEYKELESKLNVVVKDNMDLSSIETPPPLDLRNKLIIHLDDPNRPRFTLEELRQILFERNDLKARITDLEEELEFLRKKIIRPIPKSPSLSSLTLGDEELPVQGPIDKEPEYKLYPERKRLGIRRFFRFLQRVSTDTEAIPLPFSASPQSPGQS